MTHLVNLVFVSLLAAAAFAFPRKTFHDRIPNWSTAEFESSASGPEEPGRSGGTVRVVQLSPQALSQSGFLRNALASRRAPSLGPRAPFPAFLSQGRPGPAFRAPAASPLHHLQPKKPAGAELKKKQGLQMWLRAVDKGDATAVSLPVGLKDAKQTCAAVPFTQRLTADGCDTVTVHNKLCFGQCSSLFVPPEGESAAATGPHRGSAPCSRCAPSKARTVVVPLRCGTEVRERHVMVVEECKCETGREERNAEAAAASTHSELLK